MIVVAFAFTAGVLTILAPCTLAVVPFVLGTAGTGGRSRAVGVILGFGGAFLATTVLLASALAAAGLTTDRVRAASLVLLGLVGLTLLVPRVGTWFEARSASLSAAGTAILPRGDTRGLIGGLVLGVAIGLVWAPCTGPIMAAVIATAVTTGPEIETVTVATAYVAGATVPLAIVALWGRRATRAMSGSARRVRVRQGFGALMIGAVLLTATGLDVPVEAAVSAGLPADWGTALLARDPAAAAPTTAAAPTPAVAADATGLPAPLSTELPSSVTLDDLGPAPELTGITAWINSPPTSLAALRGKVVLVHFWTFACINCIHVQPYVKAWYARYASAGFVVLGVHTPELSFERDLDNVKAAVAKDGVTFPVAFDPAFATWKAYRNAYWPAFYFVDRSGHIRHVHVGEGDYAGSEQVIRELLAGA